MSELEKCEHEWKQINLASIKFDTNLYLAKSRYCTKCQMFMGFNLVDHSELIQ